MFASNVKKHKFAQKLGIARMELGAPKTRSVNANNRAMPPPRVQQIWPCHKSEKYII